MILSTMTQGPRDNCVTCGHRMPSVKGRSSAGGVGATAARDRGEAKGASHAPIVRPRLGPGPDTEAEGAGADAMDIGA